MALIAAAARCAVKSILVFTVLCAPIALKAAFYPGWLTPVESGDGGLALVLNPSSGEKDYKNMMRQLRYAVESYPSSQYRAWYIMQLATGLYELDELDAALSWFKVLEMLPEATAFAAVPNFGSITDAKIEAWFGQARCFAQQGEAGKAVAALNNILPRNDADRVLMAELQLLLNRRTTAARLLGETAGVGMQEPALRLRAGMIYRILHQQREAEALFKSVADDTTAHPSLRTQASDMVKLMRFRTPGSFVDGNYTGATAAGGGTLELVVTVKRGGLSRIVTDGHRGSNAVGYDAAMRRILRSGVPVIDVVAGYDSICTAMCVAVSGALQKARRD